LAVGADARDATGGAPAPGGRCAITGKSLSLLPRLR
jgi:hypothetical protein